MTAKRYEPSIVMGTNCASLEAGMQETDDGGYVKVEDYLDVSHELSCRKLDYEHLQKIKEHYFEEICKLKDQLGSRSDGGDSASLRQRAMAFDIIREQNKLVKLLVDQLSSLTSEVLLDDPPGDSKL